MRLRRHALALIVILLGLFATSAHAARVALVIGNDTYANVARLKNARADAKAMARALEGSGFRVTLVMDADREAMNEALRRFRSSVVGGDEAVFSYAGHAVELDGVNYLLPTDIRDDNDERVANDALPLQRVLSGLAQQKPRFSLVIIDACRDNPFAGKTRNVATRGLVPAAMAVKGQMIIYSAGAGQRALDRLRADDPSPNGVFTRVFVREIEKSGQPVHEVVRLVKEEVMRLAESVGHEQMPAIYDQSVGTFYFRKDAVGATTTREQRGDGDEVYWQDAKRLDTVDGYDAYLEVYPKGKYAAMARAAKKKLESVAKSEMRDATPPADTAPRIGGPQGAVVAGARLTLGGVPRGEGYDRAAAVKYAESLATEIQRRFRYPREAERAGLQGRGELVLTYDASGKFVEARVRKSSGHKSLDDAAIEAAIAAMSRMGRAPERTPELSIPYNFELKAP